MTSKNIHDLQKLCRFVGIISANHNLSCEFEPRSWRGVLHATLCDKVCQCLVVFSEYSGLLHQ
jgi:hypothetical protein